MIDETIVREHVNGIRREPPISNGRLAMLLFVASEVMLFAGLVTGYIVLGFGSNDFAGMRALPIGLVPYATLVLIASSVALIFAQRAARTTRASHSNGSAHYAAGAHALVAQPSGNHAHPRDVSRLTWLALLLGVLFLGLQAVEWTHLVGSGILPGSAVNSGMLYVIGGMHGLHVVGGLVILAILAASAMRAPTSAKTRSFATVAALYWHFVTLVWVTLFTMMYVL